MRIMDRIINQPDYIVFIESVLATIILWLGVRPDEYSLMLLILLAVWLLSLLTGWVMFKIMHKNSRDKEVVSNNNHAFCLHDCSDVLDNVLGFLSSIKIPSFLKFPIVIMNSDPMTIMASVILPLPWFKSNNSAKIMRGVFYHEYTHFVLGAISVMMTLSSILSLLVYGFTHSFITLLIAPPLFLIILSWTEELIADIHAVIREPFYEAVLYSICIQTRRKIDIYHPPIKSRVKIVRLINKYLNNTRIITSQSPPDN